MRYQGRISQWREDRGFGFIAPSSGGEELFVHARAFVSRQRRPVGNEVVTYQIGVDASGRACARHVAFLRETRSSQRIAAGSRVARWFAGGFLGFVVVAAYFGRLPLALPLLVVIASLVAFLAYALDKSAARSKRWRIKETTLRLLALATVASAVAATVGGYGM